jgi:hypothetical protein
MKKIISLLMLVVLCFSMAACNLSSVEYGYELNEEGDGYIVTTIDASKVITKNIILEVPAEYNGLPVKQVGYTAANSTSLLPMDVGYGKIIFPDSVEIIGVSAFATNHIGTIDFGNGLISIERSAFNGCSTLQKIELPDSLKKIGRTSFQDCKALYQVNIPNGCENIGQEAFANCESLTEIFIPASVTTIGANAFKGCDNIIIKCEATSKPSAWKSNWAGDVAESNIIWGATAA